MPYQLYLDLTLIALLCVASVYDLAQRRIPNLLLLAGLGAALALHLAFHPALALLSTMLAGLALGLLMLLPLYLLGGMAAGDVKLMATVGAFTGPLTVVEISLATYCAGGLLAVAMVLAQGRARAAAANVGALLRPYLMRLIGVPAVREAMPGPSVGGMPYAVAITAGTLLVLWLRYQ